MSEAYSTYEKHFQRMGNTPIDFATINTNLEHFSSNEQWLPTNVNARICDIGCGWGHLLLSLWASGYKNLYGVEISDTQLAMAKKGLPQEINLFCGDGVSYIKETKELFDLITIFDLLEHMDVAQSVELLRGCYEKLLPGGSVVIRVPNMANILSAYSRYMDITHINGHTEWSLFQLLDLSGFEQHNVLIKKWFNKEIWRRNRTLLKPWRGLGILNFVNTALHEFLFFFRSQSPRPSTYTFNILLQSWKI
jgi:2-polyprenyl-3-methyl-5-hydroxy-6-metoxy-1,4-benzoquinol methylase